MLVLDKKASNSKLLLRADDAYFVGNIYILCKILVSNSLLRKDFFR